MIGALVLLSQAEPVKGFAICLHYIVSIAFVVYSEALNGSHMTFMFNAMSLIHLDSLKECVSTITTSCCSLINNNNNKSQFYLWHDIDNADI